MNKHIILALSAPLFALSLAACGHNDAGNSAAAAANGATADNGAQAPSDKNLADMLGDADGLGTANDIAKTAGLDDVLKGVGPYTLFAPTDAAFKVLGDDQVAAMKKDDMKAQDAALLTAHIVPGYVTQSDIDAAIAAAPGGSATMKTMAGGMLTFTKQGDQTMVKADDGAAAALTGSESLAANGAIHPVGGLLVTSGAPAAP